jgi:hypothetical protein
LAIGALICQLAVTVETLTLRAHLREVLIIVLRRWLQVEGLGERLVSAIGKVSRYKARLEHSEVQTVLMLLVLLQHALAD